MGIESVVEHLQMGGALDWVHSTGKALKTIMGMVMHTCKPSAQETKAGQLLPV